MNLTEQKRQAGLIADMAIDPFVFLKYVKIQEPGELALPFELWGHIEDFFHFLLKYRLIDLIKAKQIGISWSLAVYALWKIYTIPGWNVLEISRGQTESQVLLDKSRVVYRNLPHWMQIWTVNPDSTRQFGFEELGSKISAFPSTIAAGIGETAGLVIHDESDFHEYYKVNLSHTSATVGDSPERQLISVSTVDKLNPDSDFKEHWKAANNGRTDELIGVVGNNKFIAKFYPYNVRPNRDEAWFADQVAQHEDDPWVVEANYPRTIKEAMAPLSATSCFDGKRLDAMWDKCVDVVPEKGMIYVFSEPRVGVVYSAGVDVGEGVGLDYSVLTILAKEGMNTETALVMYSNTLATDLFAYECDRICREYFDCLLGVENNGLGVAVLNKLAELNYPNIYSHPKPDGEEKENPKLGWNTGERNKYTGTVELAQAVRNGSLTSRFYQQVKEMMEYQWIKNKPLPTGKTHGDTVISLTIAFQMMKGSGIHQKATAYVNGKKVKL